MGIYLAEQAAVFLQSLLVGAALGILYDVFRVSRVAFPTAYGVVFAEDVLFFLICAIVTFFFGLSAIDGSLRVFLIIGELLGAVLYYFTLGRLVMGVSKKIIAAIKAVLSFIFRRILRPVWLLIYNIIALILRPFIFLSRILKKLLQNLKFRLKIRRKVLYNQLAGYFSAKGTAKAKKRKEHKHERTQKGDT